MASAVRAPSSPLQSLDRFSAYLHVLVRANVDRRLRGKLDLSGVVQQTLLEAHQARSELEHRSVPEVESWLRRTLGNNLIDEIRKLHAAKRNVAGERSLHQALEESSRILARAFVADQSTPSGKVIRTEEAMQVATALMQLPEKQREAVAMRHLQNLPLAIIAAELDCTTAAVVGLLQRGVRKLRTLLATSEGA